MASENYVGADYTPKEYIEEKVTEEYTEEKVTKGFETLSKSIDKTGESIKYHADTIGKKIEAGLSKLSSTLSNITDEVKRDHLQNEYWQLSERILALASELPNEVIERIWENNDITKNSLELSYEEIFFLAQTYPTEKWRNIIKELSLQENVSPFDIGISILKNVAYGISLFGKQGTIPFVVSNPYSKYFNSKDLKCENAVNFEIDYVINEMKVEEAGGMAFLNIPKEIIGLRFVYFDEFLKVKDEYVHFIAEELKYKTELPDFRLRLNLWKSFQNEFNFKHKLNTLRKICSELNEAKIKLMFSKKE